MPERTSYPPGTPCWIDLGTYEVEASREFYGGLFGWRGEPSPDPVTGGYPMLDAAGAGPVAALMPQAVGRQGAWGVYVGVEDVDRTAEAVGPAGGRVLLEPMELLDRGRVAIFADPDGAVVGAWEPTGFPGAAVTGEPGTYCRSELACRDVGAAVDFYGEVFGWRVDRVGASGPGEDGPGAAGHLEWKAPGGPPVAGAVPLKERWPEEVAPHWLVCFAVDDCDGTAADALELGGTVPILPEDAPPGRLAVLRDPQGALFGVVRPE